MDYEQEYIRLKGEFRDYQNNNEKELEQFKARNIKLEKDMDVLTNIIQISQYINSCIREKKLVSMINDMIVGVLGVRHSAIYIMRDGKLEIRANNSEGCNIELTDEEKGYINQGVEYLINSNMYMKICPTCKAPIRSAMGMPIKLKDKFVGYITVDHTNALTEENRIFLSSISTQIAIALENSMLYREISDIAKRDPLMGIYNRKYFFQKVEEIIECNIGREYAIVMLDLDNFKKINDTYGHQYGDEVLKSVSKIIKKDLLKNSVLARYGGEELIIYIDGYESREEVTENVEYIRKKIEKKNITLGDISSYVTSSFGVAFSKDINGGLTETINKADNLLYRAKHFGKNQVVFEDQDNL